MNLHQVRLMVSMSKCTDWHHSRLWTDLCLTSILSSRTLTWMLLNRKGLAKKFPECLVPIRKLTVCMVDSSSLTNFITQ